MMFNNCKYSINSLVLGKYCKLIQARHINEKYRYFKNIVFSRYLDSIRQVTEGVPEQGPVLP